MKMIQSREWIQRDVIQRFEPEDTDARNALDAFDIVQMRDLKWYAIYASEIAPNTANILVGPVDTYEECFMLAPAMLALKGPYCG